MSPSPQSALTVGREEEEQLCERGFGLLPTAACCQLCQLSACEVVRGLPVAQVAQSFTGRPLICFTLLPTHCDCRLNKTLSQCRAKE